jgi:hypothetical protein
MTSGNATGNDIEDLQFGATVTNTAIITVS